MTIELAPSILSANFARLAEDAKAALEGGGTVLHLDVMDGHFVPNITIGPPVVKSIKKTTKLPLDVHLMISDPDKYIPAFVDAGANILTVHAEATVHLDRTLNLESRIGVFVVHPGPGSARGRETVAARARERIRVSDRQFGHELGAQRFIRESLNKIKTLAEVRESLGLSFRIEVDGGVALDTVEDIVRAGAELLVAGNAVFGRGDIRENAKRLLGAARAAMFTRA